MLLRLGSVLTVNGYKYESVLLAKNYLEELAPAVFSAFHAPDHFQMGALLPLAVLACYGVMTLTHSRIVRRRRVLALACIVLVSFEYFQPIKPFTISSEQIAFSEWLRDEPSEARLINLPMGRNNSKTYLYHQTLHQYPQVEGLASRTLSSAYDFISANYVLNEWRKNRPTSCSDATFDDYSTALDALANLGFTHVILHRNRLRPEFMESSFPSVQPSYVDDYVTIYRLPDLRASCPDAADPVSRSAIAD